MRQDERGHAPSPTQAIGSGAEAHLPWLIALPALLAPPRHADNPRAPFVIVTAFALSAGCLFFGVAYLLQGNLPVAFLTLGGALLGLSVVVALRWMSSLTPAIHALAGMLIALLTITELMVGGPNPSNLIFLAVVPIAALFAGGLHVGLLWLAITWATLAVLAFAAARGILPPVPVEVAVDPRGVPVVVGMVFAFAVAYDRLQHRTRLALEEARARAEEASARRGDTLASMSHELRTPMNGVIGLTHALLQTPLTDDQRTMLTTIEASGRTLVDVISDILDFERIDRGLLQADADVIAPADVVAAATRVVAPLAAKAGLATSVELGDDVPPWVRGDAARLRQVLVNLLGNAIKFTSSGSIRLAVAREGEHLCFRVSDTGIGVAPELVPRLFTPFVRGSVHAPPGQGSGLGLAISRGLAELMGGTLVLESPGPGAVFALRVPLVPALAPERRVVSAVDAPRGHRVLVVEDNPVNETVARAFLASAGASCSVARCGEDALALLRQERFDVVFMDLLMPGIDGAEVTRRVRALECQTPIVAMTASVRPEDRARCLDAGMDDFLAKPLSIEAVRRVLARFPPSGAAADSGSAPERDERPGAGP